MEIQNWIMAQMVIDLMIFVVLLWFIRVNMTAKKADNGEDKALMKSESILAKIKELNLRLEQALEEKQKLSRIIIEQLDDAVNTAEKTCDHFKGVVKDFGATPSRSKNVPKNSDQLKSSVKALIAKGLKREEIAQHLGMSVDEIDLLIKLHSHPGK
jgi:hypothetical protein